MKKHILILSTALLCINAFAQVPYYVPTNGLVAYYPLDGNGNDLSSYNNNLVQYGNVSSTNNAIGNSNSACHFPNGNDYFLTPSSSWSLINNFPQGSVSFWVKIDSQYVSGHYFGIGNSFLVKQKHGVGEDMFFGMQDGTSKVRMQITGIFPSPQGADVVGSTSLLPNQWYHVVGVWDGIYHTLYVNGEVDAQILNSNGISDRPLPDYFSIGSTLYGGNGSTTYPSGTYGSLDDIGIWNRALTVCEIQQLYDNSILNSIQSVTALDSYTWPLNNQTYTQSGTYSDTLINAAGCDSIVTLNLSLNFTGLNELENTISIAPNPATDLLTISCNSLFDENYILFDPQGREILSGKLSGTATQLELSKLARGNYLLQIGEKKTPVKLVKE